MEAKEERQQTHQTEENTKENKPQTCQENSQESSQIHLQETNSVEKTTTEEQSEKGKETQVNPQNPVSDAEKGGEKKQDNQMGTSRKSRSIPRQNNKPKVTVPQPFSLATDKRMSRERRGGSEAPSPKANLAKSASAKVFTQSSSLRLERSSQLRNGTATSKSTPRGIESGPQTKEKIQGKETELKKSHSTVKDAKKHEDEGELRWMRKSSTFKASPLPSFYHQKTPPKPELKKIPSTRPKSPVLGHHRSKSISETANDKVDATSKSASTPKKISSTAKETINKLLKGSWQSPTAQRKESSKGGVPCSGELGKKGVGPKSEGKGLVVS